MSLNLDTSRQSLQIVLMVDIFKQFYTLFSDYIHMWQKYSGPGKLKDVIYTSFETRNNLFILSPDFNRNPPNDYSKYSK